MERDRIIRVSDNLKKEIANLIINSDLKDQCGFMSINHVETSPNKKKRKGSQSLKKGAIKARKVNKAKSFKRDT